MINTKILNVLRKEKIRQNSTIELIASENFASAAVMQLSGSILTNKYAEGYPGKRYYNGCEHVDEIEQLAIDYATELFGCRFANVQPHSGANANLAVFKAFLQPSDVVLGMDLSSGGHLSHGAIVNVSGAWFNSFNYGVDDNGFIDYEKVAQIAEATRPRMIIAGASAYSRVINWEVFRSIADSVGAVLLADMSHYSGLIAGKQYPNPFPWAHVVTTTTHKTLRGPRGGMILWNDDAYTKKINSAIFPGTQGGPLMHIIAAKAQCFHEALQPEFETYAKNVIKNAHLMVKSFAEEGLDVVSGGTDCHMFSLDLSNEKLSGREYANLLESHNITVNKNSIPGDKRSFLETSGIRIGTAAETTRNFDAFFELAKHMAGILRS
jgi:glycine hydroxymethyltransferase